jgi:hypothetical protein
LNQIVRIAQETLMKLVIDLKWYSDVDETLLEIKKTGLPDELYGGFLHVIDGSWTLHTFTCWYRNQPNPLLSRDQSNPLLSRDPLLGQRVEGDKQWFFYSTASFREDLKVNYRSFRVFESTTSFDFLRGFNSAVVLNTAIKPIWDSPNNIDMGTRQAIADLIEKMPLNYPEYPAWADSFPIAVLGDSIQHWHDEAGSVFCPINEAWALEISIMASLHYRKPTDQEIQMIEKALP